MNSIQRDVAASVPVTSDAGSPGVYWTPPWRDVITIRWTADDLSANSSLRVPNVDGNFSVSLQVINRSEAYCCCL